MKYSLFLSTALGLAALAAPVGALAGPAAAVAQAGIPAVDELVVTASRNPERVDRVGQQITVLTAEDLRAQQTPVLSDILSHTPGVSFSRNGGVGTATQVYIRGADTAQTLVLIDGVRLNDPTSTDNSFNFGNLLVGDIDHVEVLRGSQSVLWGSQAIGGVINLVTAQPTKTFESDFTAEGGSNAWAYGRAGIGGKTDRVTWRAATAYLTTTGISAFDEAKGGREPDGYHNVGATAQAQVKLTDILSVDLRAVYSRGRADLDGFPPPNFTFGDAPEYSIDEDFAGYAGANLELLDGRFRNRFAFTATHTSRKNVDPTEPAPFDVTFTGYGHNERYEYQGVYDIAPTWNAVFGLEREDSHMRSASSFSPVQIMRSAQTDSAYLNLRGDVLKDVTLSAGVRHDHHDAFGDHTVGQASLAWRINGGNTVVRASWGQGFKAPSLYQLGSEFGNPALKPETAKGWDAGVEQRLLNGRAVVSLAYFERRTDNQIDFVSCFAGPQPLCSTHPAGGYYDNIGRAKARGVELSGQADLTDALSVNANYTWTEALNDATGTADFGNRLARRPAYEANGEAQYRWPNDLATGVAVHYAGDRFNDAANTQRLKGYVLWDLRTSYPITKEVEVYGRIENLFDHRYETILNYGQLGRTAYAGVRAKF